MFLGAPARSLDDIARLRRTGFDFGEIAIANAGARRMWWESGVMNGGLGKFFLMAHGPLEDNPNDSGYLWNRYLPSLIATIDSLNRMSIRSLNVHLLVDRRIVSSLVLTEKIRALREIVQYGRKNSVSINLENLSESADDLEPAMNEVPNLGLTLDVGHANLVGLGNKSIAIIEKFGRLIRHVHLHDNRGGQSQADDLHLPIGDGTVDFRAIMTSLMNADYDGTLTLEVKPEFQEAGRNHIEALVTATDDD
ncbi:MAG: sugar phosphate isomerase/epimerase [Deltaproteobacteria bacterium]|nr:sugar phosphate isomerase/epimerase [Deltaproteobacteria bacterium]